MLTFCFIFCASNRFLDTWNPNQVGWTKENFFESFLWASMLLLPLTIAGLVIGYVLGLETLINWWSINIQQPFPLWLPLYGIIFWILNGIIVFSFWVGYPQYLLKEDNKKYHLFIVSILFVFLYTKPILTGALKIVDIIWLGVIFIYLYHRYENSLSLILAYVLLFEGPVLWCFAIILGKIFLLILLYIRVIWCLIAAAILLIKYSIAYLKEN
jgi:hypothetical protein